MPIVMNMEWKGITPQQYEDIKRITNIENDPPPGAMYHVAAFDGDTIRVTDVWESAEQFQKFAESKLMPTTQQLGITSQPDVKLLPTQSILAFGYNKK